MNLYTMVAVVNTGLYILVGFLCWHFHSAWFLLLLILRWRVETVHKTEENNEYWKPTDTKKPDVPK